MFVIVIVIVIVIMIVIVIVMPPTLLCTIKVLYIMPVVTGFYHFSLQQPLSGLGVLVDHLLVCQLLNHHHLPVLAVLLDKEDYFVCLLAMALSSTTLWVLSFFLSPIART